MTNTARALYEFFSSFDLPAYLEYTVPDDAQLPYITYQLVSPDWRDKASIYARLWYRSITLESVAAKADEIGNTIGDGISIDTDDGAVWLFKGSPFAQFMPMEGDDTLMVVYLNLTIHALTN